MMPYLKRGGEGKPDVSSSEVFAELSAYPWSDWPEGGLIEVVRYLRGNRQLELPEVWKRCFPEKI